MKSRAIALGGLLLLILSFSSLYLSKRSDNAPDPRIAMTMDYRATQPTEVYGLWIDDRRMVRPRMWLSPRAPKHSAHGHAHAPGRNAPVVRAFWRYADVDEDTLDHTIPDHQPPWREAQATVVLDPSIDVEALARLRNEPDRYRLSLILSFEADRLELRSEVRQWR